MALSNDLISSLVKATKSNEEKTQETTAYGKIVKQGDSEYVQLDGSDLLTPISSTTVVQDGDRVIVTIKNHTAIVTGDLTTPAASDKEVQEIGSKISEFEIVIADKVSTKQLEAEIARIEKIRTDELEATNAKIETIEGKVAEIDTIKADIVEVEGKITAHEGEFETIRGDIADFENLTAENFEAINGDFHTLESDYADFKELTTTDITAAKGSITELQTKKLDTETATMTFANIDFSNIKEAAIEKLFTDSGIIKDLIMSDGKVTGELVGVTIKGDLIEGNTVKADKLVIKGEDGIYYKLNVDALGETTASSDEKYQNGLDGSAIVANSITAEKIAVDDLVAFKATIGGYRIDDHALYSGTKSSVNNTTNGVFLGDDGQTAIGNANNYLKFYKDQNGNYKLEIQASELKFGTSGSSVEEVINEINDNVNSRVDGVQDQVDLLIKSTEVQYYLSTSSTSLSGGSWSNTAPTWVDGKYMWSRTKLILQNGTVKYSPSETGTCIAGAKGATGAQGPQGPAGVDAAVPKSVDVASGNPVIIEDAGNLSLKTLMIQAKTEQYGVSPSPEFPSEIKTIEGVTNLIPNGRWLQIKTTDNIFNGEMEIGSISGGAGETTNAANRIRSKNFIEVESNTTYYLSHYKNNIQSFVFEYTDDKTYIQRIPGNWTSLNPYVFVTSPTTKNIKIIFKLDNDANMNITDVPNIELYTKESIGLLDMSVYDEKGDVIGYHEIAKLSDNIADEHRNEKLTKKVGKVVLDGTQNITRNPLAETGTYCFCIEVRNCVSVIDANAIVPILCDIATQSSRNIMYTGVNGIGYTSDGRIQIVLDETKTMSTDEFKVWLAEHPTSVRYQLATPEEHILNYTPVILHEGYNNISLNNELQPDMYVEYYTPFKGAMGDTGTGVASITAEYYLSTSKTTQTGGSWSTTAPTWSSGKYVWTRSKIVYSNPTSTVYTTPICDSSWEAVNEIKVGGRNLLIGTNNGESYWTYNKKNGENTQESTTALGVNAVKFTTITPSTDWQYVYYSNVARNKLKAGGTYTLSFDIYPSATTNIGCVYQSGDATKSCGSFGTKIDCQANVWSKYERTVTFNSTDPNQGQGIYITGTNIEGSFIIANIKLEEGTKASAWTPAPEDIDNAIDVVITETNNKTSNLETKTDGIIAEVSNIKTVQETTTNSLGVINTDITTLKESVETKMDSNSVNIAINTALQNGVTKVNTTTGFRFDEDGLTISKTGREMSTNIDEDGMVIKRGEEERLVADNEGVAAYDLRAKTYLIVGDRSRFENYEKNGKPQTGCFWVGDTEVSN